MTTVYDVPPDALIKTLAEKLKQNKAIAIPSWANYVKTGVSREIPPVDEDWWFIRCSSILRRIYIDGPVGVERLATFYGGRHRRGVKTEHLKKGSGSVIRKALQQLERAGYVTKASKGRQITPKGKSLLDNTAFELKKEIEF
ncbi:30S ribosomal protein S19e [Methanosarcinales archaeon]|uniref:Small ribosomal subunit protein eS19 n=1 Tax=Candidatus Syntropharchaeum caldarium TaxID=1838285 RepID=A0A1F2P9U6_9EURY|nr:MAG: Ribosomal protein S19e [Candidatus Syntrophoarchaeum caldarius]RLG33669.1 MAG: 30S ribosomal protein S19e [Methanosarcinales archaeon]